MGNLQKSFGIIFPAMRISFALVLLTSCILLTAEILGFTPQENKFLIDSRTKISESLTLQMSILIPDQDIKKIQKLIRYIVKRNPDILSAVPAAPARFPQSVQALAHLPIRSRVASGVAVQACS